MDKLYLNDSYIKDFKADIVDIIKEENRILLVLDRTAFYPEGGGQPSDTGLIGNCNISYVFEENDTVYHVSDKMPENIKDVYCTIDWARRFDHMQQHCGQHILSASFIKLLDADTVGFHLGTEYATIDVKVQALLPEDAARVEKLANDIVFENRCIKYHYPDSEELVKFNLRKPPKITENIRIVEVDGFDSVPCGGTHPGHTGDIGLIKIKKWEKYRDSVRVEFICGSRALSDYAWKNEYINKISALISSRDSELLDNVHKLWSELDSSRREIRQLRDTALAYEANQLYNSADVINGVRVVKRIFENRNFKEVISLSGKIAKLDSAIALLGLKGDTAQMVFVRSSDVNININDLFKEVLPVINGKGGGNPQSAQGGGSDVSNLESALDSAYIILKNRYLK